MMCWQSGSWLAGGDEWVEVAVGIADGVDMDGGEGLKSGLCMKGGMSMDELWGIEFGGIACCVGIGAWSMLCDLASSWAYVVVMLDMTWYL